MTKSTKIRWTDVEKQILLLEVQRIITERPHLTTLTAVQEAQKIFPKERQRVIHTNTQIGWIQNHRAQWLSQPPQDVIKVDKEAPEKGFPEPPLEIHRPAIVDQLSDLLAELLLSVVADTITKVKRGLENLEVAEKQREAFHAGYTAHPKKRLRKIFVYGLRKDVSGQLERKMAGCYEFRCLDHAPTTSIRAAVDWADETYIMIDFVGHSDQDIIKRRAKEYLSKEVHLQKGTLGGIITVLEEKYLEG